MAFIIRKKKSIVDTILKNSRIKSQLKKKKIEKKGK